MPNISADVRPKSDISSAVDTLDGHLIDFTLSAIRRVTRRGRTSRRNGGWRPSFAADVSGYSRRLMDLDEEGTLARLKRRRRELIDPKIAEHRGRIV